MGRTPGTSRAIDILILLTLTIIVGAQSSGHVQQRESSHRFDATLTTRAGALTIKATEELCAYEVRLAGKLILKTNCKDDKDPYSATPLPEIYSYFGDSVAGFDEVALLQFNMLGNACNGGPLRFLGLKADGSFQLSNEIEFCGGKRPIIIWGDDKAVVTLPGGPLNRGAGYIPPETWIYQGGKVRRQSSRRRQK